MKALSVVFAIPALILTACETPKVANSVAQPVVNANQGGEEMGDPPLTLETLKVEVVKSDLTDKDAVWVEFQVKFSNKGKNHIAFLNHPNSRRIELQDEAGKKVAPLILAKYKKPALLDIVRLEPDEEVTMNFSSLPVSAEELGQNFKARMVFTPWSLGSMVPMAGAWRFREWPRKPIETSWQKLATKEIAPHIELKGKPKVEFLGVDSVAADDPDLKGTKFRAKYRITNNSPKTIVHLGRPDGLGFVVSGSKGEYANPYAAMNMMAMSVSDSVILAPGESKLCVATTPAYTESDMEKTVKVKFSLSPWDPKFIDGLPKSGLPYETTAWPAKPIESPVFTVERRH